MEQIAKINLIDIMYNGKKNSKNNSSIFLLNVVICSSDTNSTNKYLSQNIFGVSKCKYGD